jgi:hypothetical protein
MPYASSPTDAPLLLLLLLPLAVRAGSLLPPPPLLLLLPLVTGTGTGDLKLLGLPTW